MGLGGLYIYLDQDSDKSRALMKIVMSLQFPRNMCYLLTRAVILGFSKRNVMTRVWRNVA